VVEQEAIFYFSLPKLNPKSWIDEGLKSENIVKFVKIEVTW
jgi:hypothetical protein